MNREVLITLRGTQSMAQEAPETVELVTPGRMTGRNGKYAISYEETELTGTKGVKTTFLTFYPKRVVLTRQGAIESRMVFEEGTKDESLYQMGEGCLLLGVHTRMVQADLSDSGGRIFIDYTVSVEQSSISDNSYELLIEPAGTETAE